MSNSSNSSTIVPCEDGNTDPSASSHDGSKEEKTKQPPPKAIWMITINVKDWNSSNSSSLDQWIKLHCKQSVYQVEKGDSGNLHVQLTMTLKKKNRLTWLKRHFCHIAHCEEVRNEEASFNYCCKSDTRIQEPRYYPEPINAVAVEDELKYLEPFAWQKEILEIITQKPHPRKIFWYWERTGAVGKTTLVRHILLNHNAVLLDGNKRDMAYAWTGQPIVIFDFERTREGRVPYGGLEKIKDGLIFSSKYESKPKIYNRPHVICFANWPPISETISEDQWVITELNSSSERT